MADNWGNGNIDANGRRRRRSGGEEVNADVKGLFGWVVGEAAGRLTLNVVLGTDQTRERGKELSY